MANLDLAAANLHCLQEDNVVHAKLALLGHQDLRVKMEETEEMVNQA